MAILLVRLELDRSLPPLLALWLGVSLMGLALDEQFMFHEQWKYGCFQWFQACEHHWVTELPTLLTGILGVVGAVLLHRALPRGWAHYQLWSAIAIGIFALKVDLLGGHEFLRAYEEALEVGAETLFLGVLLGLQGRWAQVHQP